MTPLRVAAAAAAAVAAVSLALPRAGAERARRTPPPPVYVEECGSCHLAYPARFLGRASWRALLAGLDAHFGADATLEPAALAEIGSWLEAGARSRETTADGGEPLLRISEARWFRHEHPRPGAAIWSHPDVGSPANCAGCHRDAEAGDFRERNLRVPKKGASK